MMYSFHYATALYTEMYSPPGHCNVHFYADDMMLYAISSTSDQFFSSSQSAFCTQTPLVCLKLVLDCFTRVMSE